MTTCSICPRPLPDGTDRYACTGCEHAIRYILRGLVVDLPLLRAALIPGSRGGARQPVGRAHSPLPVNLAALDLLGPGATVTVVPDPHGEQSAGIPLGPILAGWAHAGAREHQVAYRDQVNGTEYRVPCTGAVPRTGHGIEAWCRWLLAYLGYAVTRPWVAEMHNELARALARVRVITGTEPRTHPRLAPCPRCTAFAMAARDGRWEVVCEACGHQMEPDAYAAHAAAVLPGLTAIAVQMAAAEASAGAA